jgi:outer membrane protein assembly factor BamB
VATDAGQIFVQIGQKKPDRTVIGLDARTGAIMFSQPLGGFGTKPPVTDGKSVFLQDGQDLIAFDIASKARRWTLDLESLARSGYEPTKILQNARLILDGNTLIGVDVATGIAAWRSAPVLKHPMLVGAANGVVYCRADANYYGINATNGTMLWAASTRRGEFAGQAPLDVAYSRDRFFFAAGRYVFAVSTKDGDVRAPY